MEWRKQLIAFHTLFRKETRRVTRIWVQTILPPAITTALYFLIFGKLVGSQLRNIGGYSYIDYIVPGLILMAVITNSYANVASSFYSAKFQRNIEEMLISPMPNYIILVGFLSGGVARGIGVGVIVYAVSTLFTQVPVLNPMLALLILILTSILFSLAGFINGVYARNFDEISIIPTFILTPMTYLGGVFYSIEMLDPAWRGVSLLNPILHMVSGFRHGLLGVSDIAPGVAVTMTLIAIALLAYASLYLLSRGTRIKS